MLTASCQPHWHDFKGMMRDCKMVAGIEWIERGAIGDVGSPRVTVSVVEINRPSVVLLKRACRSGAVKHSPDPLLGGGKVRFNFKSARFHTNKHDSALSGIANAHTLHPRAHHLNISPPAGPRWWRTPRSQRGTSSTRAQRAASGRARASRFGTTTRATRHRPRGSKPHALSPRTPNPRAT